MNVEPFGQIFLKIVSKHPYAKTNQQTNSIYGGHCHHAEYRSLANNDTVPGTPKYGAGMKKKIPMIGKNPTQKQASRLTR
jgi:hypothetical protein